MQVFSRMLSLMVVLVVLIAFTSPVARAADPQTRMFIMAGQSNMNHINLTLFNSIMQSTYPGDDIVVVHDSHSGEPIRKWYDNWTAPPGSGTPGNGGNGVFYDQLMAKVNTALGAHANPDHVTFLWMQGENDTAQAGWGQVYQAALEGLLDQLEGDLGRTDIDMVVGRICDEHNGDPAYPGWDLVRAAQVSFTQVDPTNRAWINTDDLNTPGDVHFFLRQPDGRLGYDHMTERFANAAIALAAVPEPGSLLLLGCGGAVLLRGRGGRSRRAV